jgi:hypothetical protein
VTVESGLRLDVDTLVRGRAIQPGAYVEGNMKLPSRDGEFVIQFESSVRDPARSWLRLKYTVTDYWTGEQHDIDDEIRLAASRPRFGGQQWWFVCPAEGRRVRKLCLPFGARRFRSRRAYRLAYASQGEAAHDRAQRRSRKLYRRLGGDPFDDHYPEKPPRMRWATYERLLGKLAAADRVAVVVGEFYDVVSGADPIAERPGFRAMLDRIAGNGVRVILVESPDRFARDLAVQLAGHDYLKGLGVELVPASAPDFFMTDTPTAVLVRQVLGAISQFEKASLVAKLRAARDRKKALTGKCGGRVAVAKPWPKHDPRWWRLRVSFTTKACRIARYQRLWLSVATSPVAASRTLRARCRRCCWPDLS